MQMLNDLTIKSGLKKGNLSCWFLVIMFLLPVLPQGITYRYNKLYQKFIFNSTHWPAPSSSSELLLLLLLLFVSLIISEIWSTKISNPFEINELARSLGTLHLGQDLVNLLRTTKPGISTPLTPDKGWTRLAAYKGCSWRHALTYTAWECFIHWL